jgi:hypothetical protein
MEEWEQRLVQAKEDLEDWAARLRAHHDGIRWDIDTERMGLSRERHEILNSRAQLPISSEEVAQLHAPSSPLRLWRRRRRRMLKRRSRR